MAPCRHWLQGHCSLGASCRFSHNSSAGGGAGASINSGAAPCAARGVARGGGDGGGGGRDAAGGVFRGAGRDAAGGVFRGAERDAASSGLGGGGRASSHGHGAGAAKNWLAKLRDGDDKLEDPTDAGRFFRELLKREEATKLALEFDADGRLCEVLQHAMRLMAPEWDSLMDLLARLGDETLLHGVYADRAQACFYAMFGVDEFVKNGSLLRHLEVRQDGHAAVAGFLVCLARCEPAVRVEPEVEKLSRFLQKSRHAGVAKAAKELVVVLSGSGSGSRATSSAGSELLPPGRREHDNDKKSYRDVEIVPTTRELLCEQPAYLPPPLEPGRGSAFLDCAEAATLDRQFRLLREDLLGTIKD